jgi:hypothetical protein
MARRLVASFHGAEKSIAPGIHHPMLSQSIFLAQLRAGGDVVNPIVHHPHDSVEGAERTVALPVYEIAAGEIEVVQVAGGDGFRRGVNTL